MRLFPDPQLAISQLPVNFALGRNQQGKDQVQYGCYLAVPAIQRQTEDVRLDEVPYLEEWLD
jgi:hypothetical protein